LMGRGRQSVWVHIQAAVAAPGPQVFPWPPYDTLARYFDNANQDFSENQRISVNKGQHSELVGGLEPWNIMTFHILGISSSQLTNSFFQRGRAQPPTSEYRAYPEVSSFPRIFMAHLR
jgi:hypothetical protein